MGGTPGLTRSNTLPKEWAPVTHTQAKGRTDGDESISGSKTGTHEQSPPQQGADSPTALRDHTPPHGDGQGFDHDATAVNHGQGHNSDHAPSSPTSSEGSSGSHAQNVRPQGDSHTETSDMPMDPHRPDSSTQGNGGPVHPPLKDLSEDDKSIKQTKDLVKMAIGALVGLYVGYIAGGAGMMEDKSSKDK